jgi:cytochrome P450
MSSAPAAPPGPRSRLGLGPLLEFRRDPTAFLERIAREHGDVAHFRLGRRRLYLLSQPEHIREVLVTRHRNFIKSYALQRSRVLLGQGLLTSEGELHLRQRRLAQPAFHRERIDGYARVMAAHAARTAAQWQDGQHVDMAEEMGKLTLAIVGKTLFDADVADEADELGQALTDAMVLFRRLTVPFSEWLDRLPLPGTRRFVRARERMDATIYRMIDEHRRAGDRGDLLSMLLLARDEEADGVGMTDLQLRDEALTLFLAGHETTANALTWTWYLLARHPEVEQRLHRALDRALAGRDPQPEDLPQLGFARQVLAEAMRLFPPAWVIGRQPLEGFDLGGYHIPAGSIVMMSPWVVQRDARFFPDPLRFEPDRWAPGATAERHRFAYFPFGAGPRKCIGEAFAWTEGTLLLAALAQRWRAELLAGHPVATQPLITLRVRNGLPMILRRREG